MKIWANLSLIWKQVVMYLLVGIIPIIIVWMISMNAFKEIENLNASSLKQIAQNISDKIDRNLFERYGDVQAFGLNSVIHEKKYWGQAESPIVDAMNQYIDTYDIYYFTLLVDLDGKVIAINSKNENGKAISTEEFYLRNFKNESWFQNVLNGKFYTSQKGNVGGPSAFSGTVILPLHVNEDVKKVYPGDAGLTLGFAAPVKDASGQVVAIWQNYARFSLVEEIFLQSYASLKQDGLGGAEMTLLNEAGDVIIDLDPTYGRGTEDRILHDFDVLFKLNLVRQGVSSAIEATQNQAVGFGYAMHARKNTVQASGYAHFQGALGFPGMNWSTLVRIPDEEINAPIIAIENFMLVIFIVIAIAVSIFGYVVARGLATPIEGLATSLENFSKGQLSVLSKLEIRSGDEIGRLGEAFNNLLDSVKVFFQESTHLLDGEIKEGESFGLHGEFEENLQGMKKSAQDKQESELEAARVLSIVENMPINVLYADNDNIMRYMNPASFKRFKELETLLPCKVDEMIGQSIDIYHKNPSHQARLIEDARNLPFRSQIQLGPEILDLEASAILDQKKNRMGTMVAWTVITDQVKREKEVAELTERDRQQSEELKNKVDSMLAVVSAAAHGDLTQEITITGSDAIGQMGDELARFFANLRRSIGSIGDNAEKLSLSSMELTGVSQQMASNASQTSSQAGLVSSSSEEVSQNVDTVAAGTEEMNASISEIAKNSQEAAKISSTAVEVATRTNQAVTQLGISSAEIGEVIKVITSIAEQTNLLALNATIEAARAGEAGKGFAVVANEVKELAKETSRATEDISQKIEAIQNDTTKSVQAIEEISNVINRISDISTTIAGAIEEQSATTSEMGRNISEAARRAQDITRNILEVAKAADDTTQGAQNTQASAGSLSEMASELKRLVGTFKY
ncbi:MAG: HAMP domain-containing protein [Candidatus Nitrohelix vancouverensis]|uniref:HAMP domain-containing protein n=1 Tax=Candidatus Nitrohelix vancouverensis TaxID=2705534 RepID=A0A7T0C1G8_9BACT|nr:MAG: HAMP domain-containing protein [Candidatus Nitrohelix vancouverensis]